MGADYDTTTTAIAMQSLYSVAKTEAELNVREPIFAMHFPDQQAAVDMMSALGMALFNQRPHAVSKKGRIYLMAIAQSAALIAHKLATLDPAADQEVDVSMCRTLCETIEEVAEVAKQPGFFAAAAVRSR